MSNHYCTWSDSCEIEVDFLVRAPFDRTHICDEDKTDV